MTKTEKQIRLCMRIMHRLTRRWYEEQGITRYNDPHTGIEQYGSLTVGYSFPMRSPVCNLTLSTSVSNYINWYEDENVR